tara:strand:- start:3927 stop:4088 length:162 start_codon:yes stop_codon:yes gene_type:complete
MKKSKIGLILNLIGLISSVILSLLSMKLGSEILLIFSAIMTIILSVLLTTWKN